MPNSVAQVIEYEGDNQTFIHRHPTVDFFTGSQLIVHESQEAVFYMNGCALDSFGPGRYTLQTQNMPLVSGFFKRVTGDVTPFHCEVYFINKTEQMGVKWGTDSKMEYLEPTYGFPIQLGACGEMTLRVEDGRKLLIKVLGTETDLSQAQLLQKLRSFLLTKVKPYIVSYLREKKINIFQIDEHLPEISQNLLEPLRGDFQEYGVSLEHFFVLNVVKPEADEAYRHFKEIHFRQYSDIAEAKLRQQVGTIDQQTAAQKMVIEAQGIAEKRRIEGYTYQEERKFDVAEGFAANEGVGQFANMGVGMGMVTGIAGSIGSQVGNMMEQSMPGRQMTGGMPGSTASGNRPSSCGISECVCASCGAKCPAGASFCPECGKKVLPGVEEKITCPSCGTTVLSGKYCPECGAPLGKACEKCGSWHPKGVKFCPNCGTSLKEE